MARNNRILSICIIGIVAALAIVHLYMYPPLSLIQLGTADDFPLEELWSQKLGNTINDLSVTEDGSTVIVRTANAIYAFDKVQGNILWKHNISPQVDYSPAVSSNAKIFVADSQSLWAFDQKGGQVIWSQSLPESGGRIVDVTKDVVIVNLVGYYIQAYDTQSGSLLWNIGVGRGFIQAYIDDNLGYVADQGITAVDVESGKTIWTEGADVIQSSSFSDGIIYYGSGNKIAAFNVKERTELWNLNLNLDGFTELTVGKGFLIVADTSYLYAFDKSNGRLVWKVIAEFPKNPSVIGDDLFVLEGFTRNIRVFDIDTGKDVGFLRTSFPYLLIVDRRDMLSSSNFLLFSRGNEIFAFGK
jgi:outer membrane protein assembly factor BamB